MMLTQVEGALCIITLALLLANVVVQLGVGRRIRAIEACEHVMSLRALEAAARIKTLEQSHDALQDAIAKVGSA